MDFLILTDANTINTSKNTIAKLFFTLQQESQATIEAFKMNETMVNAYKFQATVVKKNYKIKDSYPLNAINHMP